MYIVSHICFFGVFFSFTLKKSTMYPPVWGPIVWETLHLMTFVYPDKPSNERQGSMRSFITGMCGNLPCPGCSDHCSEYVSDNPPPTHSRTVLKKWAYDFHNSVNRRTGKRELTYEEADGTITSKYFEREKWVEIQRADEIRREDHATVAKWKKIAEENNKGLNTDGVVVVSVLCVVIVSLSIALFVTRRTSLRNK